MYEDITFDIILKRMLDRVSQNAKSQGFTIDTREGSLIYNALAPAAIELQNMYLELDNILNESFADTQSREYLIKRCAERGINVKEATKAIRRGVFNIDVPIGSRFSLNLLNYVVIEKNAEMDCEYVYPFLRAGEREFVLCSKHPIDDDMLSKISMFIR